MIRSFKLRLADAHVRIVLAGEGCAFAGAGVDLFGAAAAAAFVEARALVDYVAAQHGYVAAQHAHVAAQHDGAVRAISVDLERRRLLATFDGGGVLRLDGDELPPLAPLVAHLTVAAEAAMAARINRDKTAP